MGANDGTIVDASKLVDHGTAASCWNLVILAEGYKAAEITKFEDDAKHFITALKATPPFDEFWLVTNVWLIRVASNESGADHPPSGTQVATYFDAQFDPSIQRLLTVDKNLAKTVAANYVPEVHAIFVLVNSPYFGGSGDSVIVFSSAENSSTSSAEIALHELGHVAFGLADEYPSWVGCGKADDTNYDFPVGAVSGDAQEPNVTLDPQAGKWSDLILPWTPLPTTTNADSSKCDPQADPQPPGTVGAYDGAIYYHSGAYRPEYECKMRGDWGKPFCAVCRRRIRESLSVFVKCEEPHLIHEHLVCNRRLRRLVLQLARADALHPRLVAELENVGINWRRVVRILERVCPRP
ncbi:MAG: M64 family metallopeptidase [Planctomycetota bacterium]